MRICNHSWRESREFLETNGLGGYCSSTIIGLNTRKYHGLLVAGFSPEDRRVLLSKLDEEIEINGKTYKISTNQYWDAIAPEGYKYQKCFTLDPFPKFEYDVGGATIEKTVFMPHGFNTTIISYKSSKDVTLKANLLTTSRDANWVLQNPDWDFKFTDGRVVMLQPTHPKPPTLCVSATDGKITQFPNHNRVHKMFYRTELKRGYDCLEDLFIGAQFETELKRGKEVFIVCSASMSKKDAQQICKKLVKNPKSLRDKETKRRNAISVKNRLLSRASDQFVLKDLIIAGYPFFGVWGRDTLISLPGLCLSTGRKKEFENILLNLLSKNKKGIIPNNFSSGKDFNSIDTSLWVFWTIEKYLQKTKNYAFVRKIYKDLDEIIKAYEKLADKDGLIVSNQPGATWMDAIAGKPVTPRIGKPVEVQALWYNALKTMEKLARKYKKNSKEYTDFAKLVKTSFNKKFYNRGSQYLYDIVDENDSAVRPNALFAISMPYPILDKDKFKKVVDVAKRDLLTPYGLRTLSPKDSRYKCSAQGDQFHRDLAYHQGTVWPWLLGAFVDDYKKTYPKAKTDKFLKTLISTLEDGGIGCIAEVFDGNPPHNPEGCINQAWSVAELLRAVTDT